MLRIVAPPAAIAGWRIGNKQLPVTIGIFGKTETNIAPALPCFSSILSISIRDIVFRDGRTAREVSNPREGIWGLDTRQADEDANARGLRLRRHDVALGILPRQARSAPHAGTLLFSNYVCIFGLLTNAYPYPIRASNILGINTAIIKARFATNGTIKRFIIFDFSRTTFACNRTAYACATLIGENIY